MLKLIKTSVIGPGHVHDALPNQDAVGHFSNNKFWAIIVCDGMGSRPYADIGSRAAIKSIKNTLENIDFNVSAKLVISELLRVGYSAQTLPVLRTEAAGFLEFPGI